MGKRGPAPKPTALRLLEGNPSGRPINTKEPQPNTLRNVEAPAHLSERAKSLWNTLVPELVQIGVLTQIDVFAFTRYIEYLDEYMQAQDRLRDMKNAFLLPMKNKRGDTYLAINPLLYVKNHASNQLLKLEQQFGLTPASRSRIIAIAQGIGGFGDEEDPYDS